MVTDKDFIVGVDMARGGDMTSICVMERMKDFSMRLVETHKALHVSQKKILKIVHRALINAGLPPSKNRSDRVAKKLFYRNRGKLNVKFTA